MKLSNEAINSLNQTVNLVGNNGEQVTYTIREIAEINQIIGMAKALKSIAFIGICIGAVKLCYKKIKELKEKENGEANT